MYPTYLARIASTAESACAMALDRPKDPQAREQLFNARASRHSSPIGHAVERLTRTWRKGMRDEQKSALRIRAAAEELRQIARRMARPDDRVALTSVASSMDAERSWIRPASRQPSFIAVNLSAILTVAAARGTASRP